MRKQAAIPYLRRQSASREPGYQEIPRRGRSRQPSLLSHLGTYLVGSLLLASTAAASALVGLAFSFRNLPDVHQLRYFVPVATTHIFDVKGRPVASLHGEANREVIQIEEVSPDFKRALLAIEDSHFYAHQGINPVRVTRAVLGSLEGGLGSAGGGSTLTMQLVKNLFLKPDRTVSRKVSEAVLAVRVEQVFSKDEIFEMYLNQVYWGHNLYGVEAAAQSYFNKSASVLNLAESAMLAGILPAPETLSPFRNMEGAKRRQRIVLDRLQELGWVTAEDAKKAYAEKIKLGKVTSFRAADAPAITDAIEAEIRQKYGHEAVVRGGLRVQTTIDLDFQKMAEATVNEGIQQLRRSGRPKVQMALAAVDPRTGFIKALAGGYSLSRGQFNRASQAYRQTGSTFKPFVYYTALASGRYTPYSTLFDTPVSYPGYPRRYSPQNYDGSFYGAIPLRTSLQLSRNVPTVKLTAELGVERIIEDTRKAGITSPMQPNLSTSLGSASFTPLEMAAAYGTFANGGRQVEATLLMQVVDRNGKILYEAKPQFQQTLDPWAATSINEILQGVITSGTGTRARLDDGRPVAGKTGTTSDFRDAWFVGYVPQLSVAMWIGNDDNSPMPYGTAGGAFVAPTWKKFMTKALQGVPPEPFPSSSKYSRPTPRPRS